MALDQQSCCFRDLGRNCLGGSASNLHTLSYRAVMMSESESRKESSELPDEFALTVDSEEKRISSGVSVQGKTEGWSPPVESNDEPRSTIDAPCVHCGYDLRGLPANGRCPECGTAIARSIRGDLLSSRVGQVVVPTRRHVHLPSPSRATRPIPDSAFPVPHSPR